jgi:hypothetical protein
MLFIVRPAGRFWEFLFLIKMRSEILSVQFFFFLAPRRGAPKKKKKPPPKKNLLGDVWSEIISPSRSSIIMHLLTFKEPKLCRKISPLPLYGTRVLISSWQGREINNLNAYELR